jgi:hypothetical protein
VDHNDDQWHVGFIVDMLKIINWVYGIKAQQLQLERNTFWLHTIVELVCDNEATNTGRLGGLIKVMNDYYPYLKDIYNDDSYV